MRLGTRPSRDPREAALADVYRSRMGGRTDPRMAALEQLSDPMGEPDDDADDSAWSSAAEAMRPDPLSAMRAASGAAISDREAENARGGSRPPAFNNGTQQPNAANRFGAAAISDTEWQRMQAIRPVGPGGIGEDEVAMPGGGSARIADIMARGEMTPDLMRKARPEVWRAEETRAPGETSYGTEADDEERLRRFRANEGGGPWHETGVRR